MVAVMLAKPVDSPLAAPVIPASRQATAKVHFIPNRSMRSPEIKPTSTPARGSIPQIVPIWVMVMFRSATISGNKGGRHILSVPTIRPYVTVANTRIYHLYLDLLVSFCYIIY
jgi:hypothetical protein